MPGIAYITTWAVCQRPCLPDDDERWRAYHVGDDLDRPGEVVFYCPECAQREFERD